MSDPAPIEHRHLRSAIEYAVVMGDEIVKRKAPISVPRELRAVSGKARIPTGSLGRLRRAIDADERFRSTIAAGALPELVDPIGILWLQRPDGWQERIERLVVELAADADDADLRTSLRREEKRRYAAENVAVRLRADILERDAALEVLRADVDALRSEVVKAEDEASALRAELVDVRIEARHARDREASAKAKLHAATEVPFDAARRHDGSGGDAGEGAVTEAQVAGVDPAEVSDVARAVRELAERLDALLPVDAPDAVVRQEARNPLRLPGGVIASSAAAAEFLLRSDSVVLVDGYNVAKLAWPSRSLEAQRTQLLDALENVARRFGSDIAVVFDGASVVGAHATRRRLIRVVWSPEGVIADDVIRDEVRRLPAARTVAVVTNDAEIVADVKVLGANVVPSNALIAVL
jgi:predicted RNA-binding protein with PIN domain